VTYSQAHKLAGFQQQAAVLAQAHPNLRAFPAGILGQTFTQSRLACSAQPSYIPGWHASFQWPRDVRRLPLQLTSPRTGVVFRLLRQKVVFEIDRRS
tara:strand:+ start:675 stop:965 length:291 start_codon:yes stop_codon:yes gene_type:complete